VHALKEKEKNGASQAAERRGKNTVLPAVIETRAPSDRASRREGWREGDEVGARNALSGLLGLAGRLWVRPADEQRGNALSALDGCLCGLLGTVALAFETWMFSLGHNRNVSYIGLKITLF